MGNTLHVFIVKMLMVQNNIRIHPTFLRGEKKRKKKKKEKSLDDYVSLL